MVGVCCKIQNISNLGKYSVLLSGGFGANILFIGEMRIPSFGVGKGGGGRSGESFDRKIKILLKWGRFLPIKLCRYGVRRPQTAGRNTAGA
jgi:hypothetical protein